MIHNGIRVGNVRRGDVGFSKGCPESWLTSPATSISVCSICRKWRLVQTVSPDRFHYRVFMTGFDDYITKPDQFYNPPPVPLWMAIHSHSNCPRSRIDLLRRMHMFWSYHSIRPKARAECYSKSRSITFCSGMQTTYILRS